jgi:hypothetical protein
MADLAHAAPKLNWDDLAQVPALPLGSWLKTDPWDDKVHMLNAKRYAPMNARDKMPLEVTPIFYKLQRYDASKLTAPTPAAVAPGPGATADPGAQPTAAAPPSNTAPSPAQGTAPVADPAATPQAPPPTQGDATQPQGTTNPQ